MTILTLKEAAEFLKYHPEKVRLHAAAGRIPCKRIGHGPKARYRFVLEQLEKFMCDDTAPYVDPRRLGGR